MSDDDGDHDDFHIRSLKSSLLLLSTDERISLLLVPSGLPTKRVVGWGLGCFMGK